MTYTESKQQAHSLIERIPPSQVSTAINLLEAMLDPVDRAIAAAPCDDEPETEEERQAVAASKAWFAAHPDGGISLEDMLAEFGFKLESNESRSNSA